MLIDFDSEISPSETVVKPKSNVRGRTIEHKTSKAPRSTSAPPGLERSREPSPEPDNESEMLALEPLLGTIPNEDIVLPGSPVKQESISFPYLAAFGELPNIFDEQLSMRSDTSSIYETRDETEAWETLEDKRQVYEAAEAGMTLADLELYKKQMNSVSAHVQQAPVNPLPSKDSRVTKPLPGNAEKKTPVLSAYV